MPSVSILRMRLDLSSDFTSSCLSNWISNLTLEASVKRVGTSILLIIGNLELGILLTSPDIAVGDVILPNWNSARKTSTGDQDVYIVNEEDVVLVFED